MTVKKISQDISSSAIICLSLGLLIGKTFMPEQQMPQYMAGQPSITEAKLVDVNEGRLLERLPESSQTGSGKVVRPCSQDGCLEAPQPEGDGVQELADFLMLSRDLENQTPPLVSDLAALMTITLCAILGVIVARTDVLEMSVEGDAAELQERVPLEDESSKDTTEAHVDCTKKTASLKMIATCMSTMVLAICSFALCQGLLDSSNVLEHSNEYLGAEELRNLVAAFHEHRSAAVSDTFILGMLGACTMLALVIAKFDFLEMSEEQAHKPCEHDAADVVKDAEETESQTSVNYGSWLQCFKYFAICTVICGAGFLLSSACLHSAATSISSAEHESMWELRHIVSKIRSLHMRPEIASDSFVLLALGVCSVVALVVARADFLEMESDLKDGAPHISSKIAEKSVNSEVIKSTAATASILGGLPWTICCVAAVCLSVAISIFTSGLSDSHAAQTHNQELQYLASSMHKDLALVPDSIVTFALGAFIAIAVIIMKVDMCEMAEDASGSDVAEDDSSESVKNDEDELTQTMDSQISNADTGHRLLKLVAMVAVAIQCLGAVAIASFIGMLLWSLYFDGCMTSDTIRELEDLINFSSSERPGFLPDSLLVVVLGACSMLALAIMNVDACEMAQELHGQSTSATSCSEVKK